MSNQSEYKIVYRKWALGIPVIIIALGIILLLIDGDSYTSIGLIGSLMVIIGLLTLGVLLVSIFAITFSARTIIKPKESHTSFREKLQKAESPIQEKPEAER